MNRIKLILITIAVFVSAYSMDVFAQFAYIDSISSFSTSRNTGEKPQSKVWKHDGKWWCVMPSTSLSPNGSWLYKLNGTTWDPVIRISSLTLTHADCKVTADTTYVLLHQSSSASLNKLTYSGGSYTAAFLKTITLDLGVETSTIDIDSDGMMWLASDSDNADKINVRWSSPPYSGTWNGPYSLDTSTPDPDADDICAVTAFDGKIGVLWSNQDVTGYEFQFKYHVDGANPTNWSSEEVAAAGSNVADDHINFAVDSDGNIYAAVKTTGGNPLIGLLVRNASTGNWSSIYSIANTGTRPIVLLNESGGGTITVVYTDNSTSPDNIVYKQSSMGSISFGSKHTLISGAYNNATSTKENYTDEVVILASTNILTIGVIAYTDDPFPVELSLFSANPLTDKVILNWRTETEVNNYGFSIEKEIDSDGWTSIGFVEGYGNSNSPKEYTFEDSNIKQKGKYSYRLKQIDNDGTFEYSDIATVNVDLPEKYYLSQNYPNPFNPETKIDYMIQNDTEVSLKIYDLLGTEVATLVDQYQSAGTYSVLFNANNLASGVYIYRLVVGDYVSVKRMSLIK